MNSDLQAAAWIALVNPKSPTNVGHVMRAAGCFGVSGIFYSGERFNHARKFITDTKDHHETIPLTWTGQLLSALPDGAVPVAVELVEGATSLVDYTHPPRALYLFGPEDGSLSQDLVNGCRDVIYIPTRGCLNLAASVNIVLYDRLLKSGGDRQSGDALIRQSRDNNNRLKRQPD